MWIMACLGVGQVALAQAPGAGGRAQGLTRAERREMAEEPAPWRTERGKQETRLGIAEAMLDQGYAADARSLLALAKEEGESGPEWELLQGRALYGLALYDEALTLLQSAARRLDHDARPWRALGLLYADSGRQVEAIEAFRVAVKFDPNHAATWNNLGFLLYSVRRDPEAVPVLQQAVRLDATNARYQRNLGFALFNEGKVDEALAAFRAGSAPADAWYNLGVAYDVAGDATSALARYRQALTLDPNHAFAKEAVARLQSETP
jgi:superkiller protein 3